MFYNSILLNVPLKYRLWASFIHSQQEIALETWTMGGTSAWSLWQNTPTDLSAKVKERLCVCLSQYHSLNGMEFSINLAFLLFSL